MQWVYLCLATVCEIAGTALSKSEEFGRYAGTLSGLGFYISSAIFFVIAIRKVESSIAFAVCSALATLGVAAVGILWFREPVGAVKIVSLVLIAGGIFLLNFAK
jgi:small multidrug resistance pump